MPTTMIFKTRKTEHYVSINNALLESDAISWQAKGLLCYLLSKPPDWQVRFDDLQKHSKAGRHKLRSTIKELEDVGYIVREPNRGERGQIRGWLFSVFEEPVFTERPKTRLSVKSPLSKKEGVVKRISETEEEKKTSNRSASPHDYDDNIDSNFEGSTTATVKKLLSNPNDISSSRARRAQPPVPPPPFFVATDDQYAVLTEGLDFVLKHRPFLLDELNSKGWIDAKRKPIVHKRKYLEGLNGKIEKDLQGLKAKP